MDVAEFDRFADEYHALHADNVRLSGEEPGYFARYKVEEARRLWDAAARPEPEAVLDFGAGVGNSVPHLAALFPASRRVGLDVSQKSLDLAEHRFPGQAECVRYDGTRAPFEDRSFDLIFSACVFHHIDAAEHPAVFGELKRLLRPGGVMVTFEHNPLHPGVRHIVATCPFDQNAVLIPAPKLRRSQIEAGFTEVEVAFTAFFPRPLRFLRPLERGLRRCPIGAQYYTLAYG